jgi:hypothetical protein
LFPASNLWHVMSHAPCSLVLFCNIETKVKCPFYSWLPDCLQDYVVPRSVVLNLLFCITQILSLLFGAVLTIGSSSGMNPLKAQGFCVYYLL